MTAPTSQQTLVYAAGSCAAGMVLPAAGHVGRQVAKCAASCKVRTDDMGAVWWSVACLHVVGLCLLRAPCTCFRTGAQGCAPQGALAVASTNKLLVTKRMAVRCDRRLTASSTTAVCRLWDPTPNGSTVAESRCLAAAALSRCGCSLVFAAPLAEFFTVGSSRWYV